MKIKQYFNTIVSKSQKENNRSEKNNFQDVSDNDWRIIQEVRPFTMTSIDRINTLLTVTRHIIEQNIAGDIVECGVWKGGSMMAVAKKLLEANRTDKSLYLFDTFEGMPEPGADDIGYKGQDPSETYLQRKTAQGSTWCYAALEEVKQNLISTGYPEINMRFIKGKVEDTLSISNNIPDAISLLRLDTDWYESTKMEMELLFPRLQKGGFLIIDDYGHWKGSRKAVDEYFANRGTIPYLHRIDYTARLYQKQ